MSADSLRPFNAKEILIGDLRNHEVRVATESIDTRTAPGTLFLIVVSAKTSLAAEFVQVYGSTFDKMAEAAWGDKLELHEYGVLVDAEMKIVFAFNMLFAEYNRETCCIEYKDPQVILLEVIRANQPSPPVFPVRPPYRPPSGDSSHVVFRYSLPDPEDLVSNGLVD
jgi:hypothetical protein